MAGTDAHRHSFAPELFFPVVALLSSLLAPVAAAADEVSVPLHLEPIRLRPYYADETGAALAPTGSGFYLAYGGSDDAWGLPLLANGTAAYPNPIRFLRWGAYHPATFSAAAMGGDALAAWSEPGIVRAALQPNATWTHVARPLAGTPGHSPAVAGSETSAILAWVTDAGLGVARVDAATWPALPPPTVISPGPSSSFALTAAAFAPEAGVYLVAWKFQSFARAIVVDPSGTPVSGGIALTAASPSALSVSWNGSHFVAVWSTAATIELARISAAGVLLDVQPIQVASSGGHAARSASIAGETLVAWVANEDYQRYEVRAARVRSDGQVLDPGGFLIHQGQHRSQAPNQVAGVAAHAASYCVAWIDNYLSCGGLMIDLEDVVCAVVDSGPPPEVGPASTVSGSAAQEGVAAAWVGDRFWTAWQSWDGVDPEILAARRDVDGILLDPQGILLGHEGVCPGAGVSHSYSRPALAGNASTVLTAWRHMDRNDGWWDFGHLEYRLHDATGAIVGGSNFTYNNVGNLGGVPPVAASDGTRSLLAFTAPAPGDVILMRWVGIDAAGGLLAGGFFDLGANEKLEDAASDGTGFLMSWSEDEDGQDAYVGRFDDAFTFLDPAGIPLATGPGNQNPARLASAGLNYLAVWDDGGPLRAARVTAGGVVIDPGGVIVATRAAANPFDLDWDGQHYVLAWVEADVADMVVRLRRIAPDLSSPDPQPIEVFRRRDAFITCWVESRDDGLSLIALTTVRPWPGNTATGRSGQGILYRNPAALAVEPAPAGPAAARAAVRVFPNPFSRVATFELGAQAVGPGEVRILDAAGRVVRVLDGWTGLAPRIHWDGRSLVGRELPPGAYFYQVSASGSSPATGKLVKLR